MNWMGIGPGNTLSPGRRQAITWTKVNLFSIGSFSKKLLCNSNPKTKLFIHENSFKNKTSSAKWRPLCQRRDELTEFIAWIINYIHVKQWDIITQPLSSTPVDVTARMRDYIPQKQWMQFIYISTH